MSIIVPDSKTWDSTWQHGRFPMDEVTKAIADSVVRFGIEGRDVLEFGSGAGRLSRLMLDAGARSVTLADFSDSALDVSRPLFDGAPNANFVKADVLLDNLGKRYDLVFSSGLIEHFDDMNLARCMRTHVAHSRNRVVIIVPASPHLNDIRCRLGPVVRKYGWQRPFTASRLKRTMVAAGLQQVTIRRYYPLYGIPLLHRSRVFVSMFKPLDTLLGGLLVASGTVGNTGVSPR